MNSTLYENKLPLGLTNRLSKRSESIYNRAPIQHWGDEDIINNGRSNVYYRFQVTDFKSPLPEVCQSRCFLSAAAGHLTWAIAQRGSVIMSLLRTAYKALTRPRLAVPAFFSTTAIFSMASSQQSSVKELVEVRRPALLI